MFTGNQVWAARVLAGLTREDAAERAGISLEALTDIEGRGGAPLSADEAVTMRLVAALNEAGVDFDEGPGIRLRAAAGRDEGIRTEDLNAENDG
ncbi:DNA-binding protein [Alsobacter soli]|uniref:DNA-binding protein n=1 Tax=Alsobacter soli TaxID=2109933 RepID=A0A2T1HQM3_9HYPH|nr:helix-turn-helix transcriptional regulator [Alsobacter soli]PSC03955.1 DNA-binding protein [Alsobacter soli]